VLLPALVALPVSVGPLLRGCSTLWAQSIIHIATASGLTLWAVSRALLGYFPRPSNRNLAWTITLVLLGMFSVFVSPLGDAARPGWYNFLNTLWIFPAMAAVSKDERGHIDSAIRAVAWVLMVLAFYQRFRLGDARPPSAMVHETVYAGTILLLVPLALEKRDWLLSAGLVINLVWIESVGAWMGLSTALVLTQRRRGGIEFWAGIAGMLACSVYIYNQFQSPEVLDRLVLWKRAAAMIYDRPFLGFGPGAFADALPAAGNAHHFFLQTAAEYGVLFVLVWAAGLWSLIIRGRSYKRFGALAILIQSLWDGSLSMPGNLWLFSYFAASSMSEEPRGINLPWRYRLLLCALLLAAGTYVTAGAWNLWREASGALL